MATNDQAKAFWDLLDVTMSSIAFPTKQLDMTLEWNGPAPDFVVRLLMQHVFRSPRVGFKLPKRRYFFENGGFWFLWVQH